MSNKTHHLDSAVVQNSSPLNNKDESIKKSSFKNKREPALAVIGEEKSPTYKLDINIPFIGKCVLLYTISEDIHKEPFNLVLKLSMELQTSNSPICATRSYFSQRLNCILENCKSIDVIKVDDDCIPLILESKRGVRVLQFPALIVLSNDNLGEIVTDVLYEEDIKISDLELLIIQ